MAKIEISVVVAARGVTDAIPTLLSCFERQSLPTARYEVVLVSYGEGASESALLMEQYASGASIAVRHIHEPSEIEAKAKNMGAIHATGSLVLFLDADLLAGPKLLEMHVETHAQSGRQAVVLGQAGLHSTLPGGLLTRWFMKDDRALMSVAKPDSLYCCSSRHCSISRRFFIDEGGFNEQFRAMRAADIMLLKRFMEKHFSMVRMPGIHAFVWRAVEFEEERLRYYNEGFDLTLLADYLKDPDLARQFGLSCSSLRFWIDDLYMPLYARTCQEHDLDIRVHGYSCRKALTHERHRGVRDARQETLDE